MSPAPSVPARIADALDGIDVIVKSPGVSLYRPRNPSRRAQRASRLHRCSICGLPSARDITTICVTGTKGKSTTAALIAHMLRELGRRVALAGNIGVADHRDRRAPTADYAVIEVSSYQAADFDGICDIARADLALSRAPRLASLGRQTTTATRSICCATAGARIVILGADTAAAANGRLAAPIPGSTTQTGIDARGDDVFDASRPIGPVRNRYLARPHNRSNLCARADGGESARLDPAAALAAADDFAACRTASRSWARSAGVLFVDDSISTIPESTIAALGVYAGRAVTVIVGGYDRGSSYGKLVAALSQGAAKTSSVSAPAASGFTPRRKPRMVAGIFTARNRWRMRWQSHSRRRREAVSCCCRRRRRAMARTVISPSAGAISPPRRGFPQQARAADETSAGLRSTRRFGRRLCRKTVPARRHREPAPRSASAATRTRPRPRRSPERIAPASSACRSFSTRS